MKKTHNVQAMPNLAARGSAIELAADLKLFTEDRPAWEAKVVAEGARRERERIRGIWDQRRPGHEALVNQMIADGVSTGEDAAVAILRAERRKMLKVVRAGHE